jgi:hypothetical protein
LVEYYIISWKKLKEVEVSICKIHYPHTQDFNGDLIITLFFL